MGPPLSLGPVSLSPSPPRFRSLFSFSPLSPPPLSSSSSAAGSEASRSLGQRQLLRRFPSSSKSREADEGALRFPPSPPPLPSPPPSVHLAPARCRGPPPGSTLRSVPGKQLPRWSFRRNRLPPMMGSFSRTS